jgi:Kef-type K+ transport system membrane component KefB
LLTSVASRTLDPLGSLPRSPAALFIVQAATIVLLARALGLIARRLGQPMVVAELFAGIVLGPSLLGWAWPSGWAALFPAHSLPVLDLLSQVGLILFMFLIALSFDPKLPAGARRRRCDQPREHPLPFLLGGFVALTPLSEARPLAWLSSRSSCSWAQP